MGILSNLIGSKEKFTVEARMFHTVTLFIALSGVLGFVYNYFLDSNRVDNVFNLITLIFGIGLFLYSRLSNNSPYPRFILITLTYIFLLFYWYSKSEILEIIVIMFLGVIVWQVIFIEKYQYVFFVINVFLLAGILFTQYYFPGLKPEYEIIVLQQLFDILIAYFFIAILLFLLLRFVIKRYQSDKLSLKNKNDELEQSNAEIKKMIEVREKLFSIISHDLKSPLGGIINLTDETIIEKNLENPEKMAGFLGMVNQSARELDNLLNNLLLWSRFQSKTLSPHPVSLSPAGIIENIAELYRLSLKRKNLVLKNEIPPDVKVFFDPDMLETIIRNLISNAIKFSPKGELIRIYYTAEKQDGMIALIVEDNGIGLSEDEIADIMSRNDFGSKQGTDNETGNGLGLMVCREFAIANGGNIQISADKNKGSRFAVLLPAYRNSAG